MIELKLNNRVLTLRLAHGKASVLDMELLEAISASLDEARANNKADAVILTGSGTIFSAGVDLKKILDGGMDYANQYIPVLDRVLEELFTFPKPIVAAVNGHAIAGGCILALACDYKIMATGKGRMGIPELKVGVPFPSSAFEIVRFSVPKSQAQALFYRAETMLAEEAQSRGMVDELAEPDALQERAQQVAEELGAIAFDTFVLTKQMLRSPSISAIRGNRQAYGDVIQGAWADDAAYRRIRAYLDQTLKN